MACYTCKEEKPSYKIISINNNTVFEICPDCFKKIILDNYFMVNMLKAVIPWDKRKDLDNFINFILNENEKEKNRS